jgi:hypothetical protein
VWRANVHKQDLARGVTHVALPDDPAHLPGPHQ